MRKLFLFIFSLGIMMATWVPLYAQDASGQGTTKILGVDVYQRATQELQNQQYAQAVSDFSLVILLNPTFVDPYLQRANAYIQLKNYDLALVDLNHLINQPLIDASIRGQAFTARAELSRDQNNMEAAIADYDAAIKLMPDDAKAYFERGVIYYVQAEYEKAFKDMTQVVSIRQDFPPAYYILGVVNNQLKQYADAVKQFDTYIKVQPDDYQGYAERARAFIQQEEYQKALTDLNQALKLGGRDVSLILRRGLVQQKLGDEQASADDYLTWVKTNIKDEKNNLVLRPGESQVIPMGAGLAYIFAFDGRAGDKVTLTTSTQPNQQIDSLLILADDQLKPLTADDDSGGNMNAAITNYVLPATGSYSVILSHAGGNPNGNVRLLLNVSQ
jgi:tetratricopeptide (TPR) repeat protein